MVKNFAKSVMLAGPALDRIQKGNGWRHDGFKSWDAYCRTRLGKCGEMARKIIRAFEYAKGHPALENLPEGQLRELREQNIPQEAVVKQLEDAEKAGNLPKDIRHRIKGLLDSAKSKKADAKLADARKVELGAFERVKKSGKLPWTLTDKQNVVPCQLLLTDPPYGVTRNDWEPKDLHEFIKDWATRWNNCGADNILIFCSVKRTMLNLYMKCLTEYAYQLPLIWHYRNNLKAISKSGLKHSYDPILWFKRKGSIREIGNGNSEVGGDLHNFDCHVASVPTTTFKGVDFRQHPCQKPLSVMRWLVNAFSKPGDVVADPFCGSAPSGIASVMLYRKFYGIDIKPEYLALADGRISLYGAVADIGGKVS